MCRYYFKNTIFNILKHLYLFVSNVPSGDYLQAPVIDQQNPECCPRCGKKVYFAEQRLALGRKWHKMCFSCGNCSKIFVFLSHQCFCGRYKNMFVHGDLSCEPQSALSLLPLQRLMLNFTYACFFILSNV